MKKQIALWILIGSLWACEKEGVDTYNPADHYLYVLDSVGRDTAVVSFAHHPGETMIEVPFELILIGQPLQEALAYRLIVVDSLTTAQPGDYELPELLFGAYKPRDTVKIRIFNKRPELAEQSVKVVFRIAENQNFKPGYCDKQDIGITFSNIKSQPLWWTKEITDIYLGKYSEKKYEHFVICTKVADLTDVEPTRIRLLCLEFKDYCIANRITEEDEETPMADGIPCY